MYGHVTHKAKVAEHRLFAVGGFEERLRLAAREQGVLLVSADEMYAWEERMVIGTADPGRGNEGGWQPRAHGVLGAYVHHDGRVGALVELACETAVAGASRRLRDLARSIAMQVAATGPTRVSEEQPPADALDAAEPLLRQAFIRDPGKTVRDLLDETSAALGERVSVRRFARFRVGGE